MLLRERSGPGDTNRDSVGERFTLCSSLSFTSSVASFAEGDDIYTVKLLFLRERQSPYRKSRGDNIYFTLLNSGKAHHSRDGCLFLSPITLLCCSFSCPDFAPPAFVFFHGSVCEPAWAKFPHQKEIWLARE